MGQKIHIGFFAAMRRWLFLCAPPAILCDHNLGANVLNFITVEELAKDMRINENSALSASLEDEKITL